MRKRETPRTLIYKGFQAFLALVSVKLGIILLPIFLVNLYMDKNLTLSS